MAKEIKLYNTLTRNKDTFTPLIEKEIGMYCCGPTVYNYAHIGNLRCYIFEDVLRRVLLLNNFKLKHVVNITDVGHLTSDADAGEDKMLKAALRENKSVWAIAEYYTKAFMKDIEKLNIQSPEVWCKATEHIDQQIAMVKRLEDNGFTYQAGGNVYFDTSKLDDYGKLALLDLNAEQKSRVETDINKKNKHDFVLWFTVSKFQDQEMKWDSPWGVGYPGWHIECSAMSSHHLGEQFDIHCGGIDHISVHHTNEIAQAEAAFGKKPWVNYWLHSEFLVLTKGEKMAKSGENFITLAVLEKKGFSPLDYRYFCLGTHYRKSLMFSYDALESAKHAYKRLIDRILELKKANPGEEHLELVNDYAEKFTEDVNDDLNTPKVLALVWEVVKEDKLSNGDKLKILSKFDDVLGLGFADVKSEEAPEEIVKLAEERLLARNEKDWTKSDELRDKINSLGYDIGDTKEGYALKKR